MGVIDLSEMSPPDPRQYRPGPDGLPARIVGGWVDRKVHFVDRYVHLFATGMSRRWPHRAYVELFSGPGLSWDRSHKRFIKGSPLRALDADITDYCFIDADPWAAVALHRRITSRPGLQGNVVIGDCNDAASFVREHVPANALTLAFVDPTTWQIRLDSLSQLVDGRRVDLIVTFQVGAMLRVRKLKVPALDAFFGTDEWRPIANGPPGSRLTGLLQLYNRQLMGLGYLSGAEKNAVLVKNSKHAVIYALLLFTHHNRGYDFWRKAIDVDESGQGGFWDAAWKPRREVVPRSSVELPARGFGRPAAPLLEEEGDLGDKAHVSEVSEPLSLWGPTNRS